jgi:diguanylate cyclase (GGDEF)-like protein
MSVRFNGRVQIPDSRFAAELGRGSAPGRFAPGLESEYDAAFLSERRNQVRSFNVLVALLTLGVLLLTLRGAAAHEVWPITRLTLIAAGCTALAWASCSGRYLQIYPAVGSCAALLVGVVGALEVARHLAAGQSGAILWIAAWGMAAFFTLGLRFGPAMQVGAALLVALTAALVRDGQDLVQVAQEAGSVALVLALAGLARYQQALRHREDFLERGLIVDLAARDGLTGLNNRRAFDEHLIRSWQQALRDRKCIALMFIDVDAFKRYNDRYGHKAGDVALQRIAGVVHGAAKRALDLAARYGGEELAVILYDVPRETALPLAESMRHAVMDLAIEHLDGIPLEVVTISIGVSIVTPTLARSPDGAVQLADEALYAAKRNGRNRVELFESEYEALSTGNFRSR